MLTACSTRRRRSSSISELVRSAWNLKTDRHRADESGCVLLARPRRTWKNRAPVDRTAVSTSTGRTRMTDVKGLLMVAALALGSVGCAIEADEIVVEEEQYAGWSVSGERSVRWDQ